MLLYQPNLFNTDSLQLIYPGCVHSRQKSSLSLLNQLTNGQWGSLRLLQLLLYVHSDHKVYQLLRDGEPPRTAISDVYTSPELSASSTSSSSSSSSSNVAPCGMIKVFKLRITSTEIILQGLLQTGGAQDGHLSSELLLLVLLLLLMLLYVHRDYIARTITDRGSPRWSPQLWVSSSSSSVVSCPPIP